MISVIEQRLRRATATLAAALERSDGPSILDAAKLIGDIAADWPQHITDIRRDPEEPHTP